MRTISGGNTISDPHEQTNGLRAGGIIGKYYTAINSWMRDIIVAD